MSKKIYGGTALLTKDMWKEILLNDEIFNSKHKELLNRILEVGGSASASEVTKPYGEHSSNYNSLIGNLGKKIIEYFNINLDNINKPEYWTIPFKGYKDEHKHFVWIIRKELIEAIDELGITIPEYKHSGEFEDKEDNFPEGAKKIILVNKYERNIKARNACIAHYGYNCFICEESLEDKYGSLGFGIIHVHHIVPLNKIGKHYIVNPINDLRPVCPNCHALVHKVEDEYNIYQVKDIIKNKHKKII